MKKKKITFKEGDVFAVPLGQGKYGIGLIAKESQGITLGYFFNIIFSAVPQNVEAWVFDKKRVVLIGKFSPMGIENGEWPLIISDFKFKIQDWPIPVFKIQHPITEKFFSVQYDETLINEERHLITEDEASKLFKHGLYGYVSLEKHLNKILLRESV